MSLPIIIGDAAQAELDDAVDWYELQQSGMGSSFAIAVDRILERIASQPDFYPVIRNNVRQGIVHRYPYSIFYREQADSVLVVAVFHNSRNPARWQERT